MIWRCIYDPSITNDVRIVCKTDEVSNDRLLRESFARPFIASINRCDETNFHCFNFWDKINRHFERKRPKGFVQRKRPDTTTQSLKLYTILSWFGGCARTRSASSSSSLPFHAAGGRPWGFPLANKNLAL